MYLTSLHLHNFRVYQEARFEFSPHMNSIRGLNARGKTSLLEAIYFLITGHSFRTTQTKELIRHGADYFYLEAHFFKHGIEQKLKIYYSSKEKRVTYNSTVYSSLNHLLGILQGVVIHPDDALIVKGAPTVRRHLFDTQLAQIDPLYVHHLTRYERAMRQRNHLLRAKSTAAIDSWEYEMAHAAAYIVQQRAHLTAALCLKGQGHYQKISGDAEKMSLNYKANGMGEHSLLEIPFLRDLYKHQYFRHRFREMDFGSTLTGPHKDDLVIALSNNEARAFASEGQQRSCVLALRLAEWERMSEQSEQKPLMLIDDFGIGLDSMRRKHLLHHFTAFKQVFVTTTETSKLIDNEHSICL